jgi:hypothetical protein
MIHKGRLNLSTNLRDTPSLVKRYISPHRSAGWNSLGGFDEEFSNSYQAAKALDIPKEVLDSSKNLYTEQTFDFYVAQGLIDRAKQDLRKVDRRFGDLDLIESRRFEMPVDGVQMQDDLSPQAEKNLMGIKLIFTTGTPEKFQANGVGETYEKAMGSAIQQC